jgi:DNA repair protein RecO (recombination protein O)
VKPLILYMSKPRNYQTEAVIIKKTKLGEADSILTLYTPHLGKIQGFARSLRKPKSKMAGHLELLTHSQIWLARGRNIDTITGAQTINSFMPLKTDLDLTSYALYATELINQFAADNVEDYPLFQLLVETLQNLSQGGDSDLILRYFELHLLDMVGYRPQLDKCVSCKSALKEATNLFSPSAGGMLCPRCSQSQLAYPLSEKARKVLLLLQNSDYSTIKGLEVDRELSRQLEMVMRNYLSYLLEREVKSTAWLDSLRGQIDDTQIRPYYPTTPTKA